MTQHKKIVDILSLFVLRMQTKYYKTVKGWDDINKPSR